MHTPFKQEKPHLNAQPSMNWENMDGTMKTLGSVENPEKNRKDIYYQKPNANLSKKHKRTTGQQELRGKMTLNLLKNKMNEFLLYILQANKVPLRFLFMLKHL